ncbi:PREDICTED: collagen alpha-3(IX) chain-like [Chinchilla lanigera]|uniref:collagen alpha-3(IX) chain-like n=1 Tax=Chinchilla lanigera TaxID=34839 RepID=UPI000698FBA1|nr:PREDICTED: collagen alpha-3(IX) chain-like [Chinchilla lanigera]
MRNTSSTHRARSERPQLQRNRMQKEAGSSSPPRGVVVTCPILPTPRTHPRVLVLRGLGGAGPAETGAGAEASPVGVHLPRGTDGFPEAQASTGVGGPLLRASWLPRVSRTFGAGPTGHLRQRPSVPGRRDKPSSQACPGPASPHRPVAFPGRSAQLFSRRAFPRPPGIAPFSPANIAFPPGLACLRSRGPRVLTFPLCPSPPPDSFRSHLGYVRQDSGRSAENRPFPAGRVQQPNLPPRPGPPRVSPNVLAPWRVALSCGVPNLRPRVPPRLLGLLPEVSGPNVFPRVPPSTPESYTSGSVSPPFSGPSCLLGFLRVSSVLSARSRGFPFLLGAYALRLCPTSLAGSLRPFSCPSESPRSFPKGLGTLRLPSALSVPRRGVRSMNKLVLYAI